MKYKKSVHKTFALISQLGISMIVPILMCVFLGNWLEEKLVIPVTIPFIILGVLAGGRNVYLLARHANEYIQVPTWQILSSRHLSFLSK